MRNRSFLGIINKKYSVKFDSPASSGGEEKYLKCVSLRLRQQCQFLMLAFKKKHFSEKELIKTKEIAINDES